MDDLELVCMPSDEVPKIWDGTVRDMIDAGFAASDVPMPDDLLEKIRYGYRLLWLVVRSDGTIIAAMLTELFEMRSGKVCKMLECAGSRFDEWKHLRSEIERYAKGEGCDRVMVIGRRGFARAFDDYKITAVVLEKRI